MGGVASGSNTIGHRCDATFIGWRALGQHQKPSVG